MEATDLLLRGVVVPADDRGGSPSEFRRGLGLVVLEVGENEGGELEVVVPVLERVGVVETLVVERRAPGEPAERTDQRPFLLAEPVVVVGWTGGAAQEEVS